MTNQEANHSREFIVRLLSVIDDMDCHEDLIWRTSATSPAPRPRDVVFFVNVSDVFEWGTNDFEEVTEENIEALEQAVKDLEAIGGFFAKHHATTLFAARVRGARPQGAWYKHLTTMSQTETEQIQELFDACGPVREVDILNPVKRP